MAGSTLPKLGRSLLFWLQEVSYEQAKRMSFRPERVARRGGISRTKLPNPKRFLHFGRNDSRLHSRRSVETTDCTCHLDWREPATAMERSPVHCLNMRFLHFGRNDSRIHSRRSTETTGCTCHLDWRELATAMERSPWLCPEHEISPLRSK